MVTRDPEWLDETVTDMNRVAPYRVALLDINWPEAGGGKNKRGADRHYELVSVKRTCRLLAPLPYLMDPDSHLWCWTSDKYVLNGDLALVAEAVQHRPVAMFPWVKTTDDGSRLRGGIGQYSMKCHELLVLMTRGTTAFPPKSLRPLSVMMTPRTKRHSEKPETAYELIDRVSRNRPGPRVELYARQYQPGWESVGWELPDARIDIAEWLAAKLKEHGHVEPAPV